MKARFGILAAVVLVFASCGVKEDPLWENVSLTTASQLPLGTAGKSIFLSVNATGAWTLTLEYPGVPWGAAVKPESGTGAKNSIIFSYPENTGEDARSVTVVLTAEHAMPVSLNIVQSGTKGSGPVGDGKRGYGYTVAQAAWLELPATSADDEYEWFAHDMDGGDWNRNGGERNYSFEYDYDSYMALWVAYPLNKSLGTNKLTGTSRTDAWGLDPLIPSQYQQSLYSGFPSSNTYARGHQLPSADRRLSWNNNASTFYFTNMTPQMHNFNEGVWAGLETKVRGWADTADTLYVVTGCTLAGSTTTTPDNSGKDIPVPDGYFKALLMYMPGSTLGIDGYRACGFWLPHKAGIGNNEFMNYKMSIDELETKTGFDFFVNLPAKVGADKAAQIEAQSPDSWK